MKAHFAAAPMMVAMAGTLWFGPGFFMTDPNWVFLPLWGLFPGETSFSGPLAHLALVYAWVVAAAAVFASLALLAFVRNNALAAAGFLLLLLVSASVGTLRANGVSIL